MRVAKSRLEFCEFDISDAPPAMVKATGIGYWISVFTSWLTNQLLTVSVAGETSERVIVDTSISHACS